MNFPFKISEVGKWLERPVVRFAWLFLLAITLFAATLSLSSWFSRYVARVSQHWFARGEHQISTGRPQDAVNSYRTALVYSRENELYGLRLGEALATAGLDDEAKAYLTSLWERRPGDGVLNLQLARIAVREGDLQSAARYFHGAIYGAWDRDAAGRRREARVELIDFLLTRKFTQQAESELIALLPEMPEEPGLVASIADRFMRTGDYDRALQLYARVLSETRGADLHAKKGAAMAAFHSGQYRLAERYFGRLSDAELDDASRESLAIASAVNRLDPMASGLRATERANRVMAMLDLIGTRFRTCEASLPANAGPATIDRAQGPFAQQLADWKSLKREASVKRWRDSPGTEDQVLRFIFNGERVAAGSCGEGSPADKAIALLGKKYEARER